MTDRRHEMRDGLLESEPLTTAYQQSYEKAVRDMLEKRLTPAKRWLYVGVTALCVGQAILFGWQALTARELPPLARLGLLAGTVFAGVFAVLVARIVQRGVLHLKTDEPAMAGMGWACVVVMVILFMLIAGRMPDTTRGVLMVANGLVFLVMAATGLVLSRVGQAELRTREKLLEIEYRLAEMGERMGKEG